MKYSLKVKGKMNKNHKIKSKRIFHVIKQSVKQAEFLYFSSGLTQQSLTASQWQRYFMYCIMKWLKKGYCSHQLLLQVFNVSSIIIILK